MPETDRLISSLADIAAESFRLRRVFMRAVRNADAGEYKKYVSQFSWFEKKVDKALKEAGLSVVDLSGQRYDPGMAVTPLNLDDFDPDTELVIDRMMEPVIMKEDRLIRTGTVILREE
jgi:hypothetical protein